MTRWLMSDDIAKSCQSLSLHNDSTGFDSIGNCDEAGIRVCVQSVQSCLRSADDMLFAAETILDTIGSDCALLATELDLQSDASAGAQFLKNLKIPCMFFIYAATALSFRNTARINAHQDEFGRIFARVARLHLPPKVLPIVVHFHSSIRTLYLIVILNAPNIGLIITFYMSQISVTCIAGGYWCFSIAMLIRPNRALAWWLPLTTYASIIYLALYVWQFEAMVSQRFRYI